MPPRRCPVCGTPGSTCGGVSAKHIIEIPSTPRRNTVGPLKPYQVEVNGTLTTLRLSDADAARRGLIPAPADAEAAAAAPSVPAKVARPPANKARQVPGK